MCGGTLGARRRECSAWQPSGHWNWTPGLSHSVALPVFIHGLALELQPGAPNSHPWPCPWSLASTAHACTPLCSLPCPLGGLVSLSATQGPWGCLARQSQLGWGHKAMRSMSLFVPGDKVHTGPTEGCWAADMCPRCLKSYPGRCQALVALGPGCVAKLCPFSPSCSLVLSDPRKGAAPMSQSHGGRIASAQHWESPTALQAELL